MKELSNEQVLTRLKALTRKERAATLCLLLYLNEVERRGLFAPMGYSTMFAFATRHLQYSESGAARRLRVARCFRDYPELVPLFRRREVNMSTVTAISGAITPANRAALIEAARGKSRREVDVLVAGETPPVRVVDSIRPSRVRNGVPTTAPPARSHGQSDSGTGPDLFSSNASEESVREMRIIRFAASPEFEEKLQAVRALLSTRYPNGVGLEQTIEAALESFLDKHDPQRRHQRREKRAKRHDAAEPKAAPCKREWEREREHAQPPRRHIPAHTRDDVTLRDEGCCTFVGRGGVRCRSRHNVQIDHIRPYALGGSNEATNLRLLCATHNRLAGEQCFGKRRPPSTPPPPTRTTRRGHTRSP